MNICVVSTFEGEVEEFLSMVEEFASDIKAASSDFEIGIVNTNRPGFSKVITMANITDDERFQELMSSPKMVEWDKAHNNTDIIYSLKRVD